MAEKLGEAVLELRTDLSQFRGELNAAQAQTNQSLSKMEERTKRFSSLMQGAAAIGGVVIALRGLYKIGKDLIDSYMEQERANTKLAAALKATGGAVGITADEMGEFARQMQRTTTFGDEAVTEAQALMVTFTQIGRDVFPEAVKSAADMSVMFGGDLQQSVIQLGTALNDPIAGIGRLKRIGISFTEDQKASIQTFMDQNDIMSAQAVILDEIKNEFGGVAEAMGATFQGRLEQLKNAWGDIKEIVGKFLAESAEPVITWLLDFLSNAQNIQIITKIVQGFGAVFGTVFSTIVVMIKTVINYYKLWGETLESLWSILKVVFDPRQWGQGKIKEELRQLADATVAIAKDVVEDWATYGEKMAARWKRVFGESTEATIKAVRSQYQLQTEEGDKAEVSEKERLARMGDNLEDAYRLRFRTISDGVNDEQELKEWAAEEERKQLARSADTLADVYRLRFRTIADSIDETEEYKDWMRAEEERKEREHQSALRMLRQAAFNFATDLVTSLGSIWDSYYVGLLQNEELTDEERKKLMHEQAVANKAVATFKAIIDTAAAIIGFLANPGGWPGVALSVLAGITGAVQIAAILAQPIPTFAQGVSDFIVPPGYPNDSFLMGVSSGETVDVTPAAGGGESGLVVSAPLNLYIDRDPIYRGLLRATKDGIALVAERAVVP